MKAGLRSFAIAVLFLLLAAPAAAESLEKHDFSIRAQIIWAKERLVMGRGDYHWQHEPCWYAVRSKGHWTGDRKQTTLWTIPSGGQDAETIHSTQKPVECMRRPKNNSNPGQAIYDPFLGSGSSLIAAETVGRVCLGMDIDPRFVDVAVRRWQAFTGKEATCLRPAQTSERSIRREANRKPATHGRPRSATACAAPAVAAELKQTRSLLQGRRSEVRGRKPKSTRLKMLTGNPGKHRLNYDEPRPEVEIPECPPELGPAAQREWQRLVGDLAALRLLTNLDRAALAAYCGSYALWAEAMEAIQKFGAMVKSPSGYPIQSPYVAIANRQAEIMMRIAAEFGFTPASRSRIATPSPEAPTLFDVVEEESEEGASEKTPLN